MVTYTIFVLAIFTLVSAIPQPSITREKFIIRTPITYKTIHHYRIQKIPVFITKHIHKYKSEEENTLEEEGDTNHISDDHKYDHHDITSLDFHHQEDHKDHNHQDVYNQQSYETQDDYDEPKHSQEEAEEEYNDYEYE